MLQLRRRFSKAFNTPKISRFSTNNDENDPSFDSQDIGIGSQCQLPTELLLLIASYIIDKRILANLCRVSKGFNYVYTPELYKVISVHSCTSSAVIALHYSLYNRLRKPQLSYLVTELRLCNRRSHICGKFSHKGDVPGTYRLCTCTKYEQALGKAIVSLRNLHSLTILCTLCEGKHNHGYLLLMDSPLLRRFAFLCFNFNFHATLKTDMHRVPFMPQVTTLNLECYDGWMMQPSHPTLSIQGPPFVPLLSTLCHDGTDFARELLSTRPIQRLCLNSWTHRICGRHEYSLHRDILRSPGKLTHLFMLDLLQWLPNAMATDPEPYRHLRFIGTLSGHHCEDDAAFEEMESLRSLVNLETIEINRFRLLEDSNAMRWSHRSFQPGLRFFALLETRHPLLRRVLLMARIQYSLDSTGDGVLWEKYNVWSSRRVPYLEYWDILWHGPEGAEGLEVDCTILKND